MATLKQAADEFLAQRRIAVAGVSRTDSGHGANVVYKGLRKAGYEVFAVNPNAEQVDGDRWLEESKVDAGGGRRRRRRHRAAGLRRRSPRLR